MKSGSLVEMLSYVWTGKGGSRDGEGGGHGGMAWLVLFIAG